MASFAARTRLIVALVILLHLTHAISAQPVAPASVDDFIRASMEAAHIPGLALSVVRDDRVIYLKGYGTAGPDHRPVTPQTPFILGSTSKSFTALAIMQLVEAGTLDLDAPVTTYLPWFRTDDATGSGQITVRHLLYQTSGLRTSEGLRGLEDNDQGSTALENGVRELLSAPLAAPAGQRFEYSNANYNTLGLIVQTMTGLSYEDYVRSAIFNPLQMHRSAAALSDNAASGMASGHRYWLGWPLAFDAPYPRRAIPAGFLISSAEDMAHYVVAQLNGGAYAGSQLLSSKGITTLHAPGARIAPALDYGLGWAIRTSPGPTTVWHDGDVSNFHSHVRLIPEQRLGIVVLMNVGGSSNGTAIETLVNGIAGTLLGHSQEMPTTSAWATLSHLSALIPLLVAVGWAVWSYRFRRISLPLIVDLTAVWAIWVLVPATMHTPMGTIALFAPDVFAVGIAITMLAVGCAIARVSARSGIRSTRPRRSAS